MIKKLLALLVIVAVVVGIGFFVLLGNLDTVVKEGLQRTLSFILEVDVTVGEIELSLKEQRVEIADVIIANPPGFTSAPAFSVTKATVAIDAASFQQGTPHIRLLSVTDPKISVEVNKGEGMSISNNIKTLIDSANRFAADGDPASTSSSTDESEQAVKPIIIDAVEIENSAVRVASNLIENDAEFTIPQVQVTEIGTAEGGVPVSKAVGQILTEVLKAALKTGNVKLPVDPAQLLEEADVSGKIDEAREKVESKIGDAVKGLFNKDE